MARLRQKGRITDYQFIASSLRRLPLMNIGLPDLNPRSPRRREGVFPRLSGGLFVQFYRLDMHIISGTLREHQRQQAAARANIQHMLHSGNRRRAPSKMPSVPTFMAQRS